MKGLNFLAAFLGGAAVGAAFGILFAPEKGTDTRQKIKDILREKGIKLNRSEMEELVDQIAAEVKDAAVYLKQEGIYVLGCDGPVENSVSVTQALRSFPR